jgi:hypothetical protein
MALFGKSENTLDKPYLSLLAKDLDAGVKIKFTGGDVIVIKTPEILALIRAIQTADKRAIDKQLLTRKTYNPIFVNKITGKSYKWTQIDKSKYSGMGGVGKADAKTTAMQERASMYAIEQGLNKNGFRDKTLFLQKCGSKLREMYPDMDNLWEDTFFQQQITVAKHVPSNRHFKYSRDDGFMEDITQLVKRMGIAKKDTWNPADIWLVENPIKQMELLKSSVTIREINAKLIDMFNDNIVVGISLKKMSGKTARWELVNVNVDEFKNMPSFKRGNMKCLLNLNGNAFQSTDTVFGINDGSIEVAKVQIRQNSKGFNNLKFEATARGATAARMGKVPLDMLVTTMKGYKVRLDNKHQNYPKTDKAFKIESAKYKVMFNKIKPHVETKVSNADEFVQNMMYIYSISPDIAMSKLMQIDFLSKVVSMKKDDYNDLTTNIYFLAQKKGQNFGPFGKLY